MVVASVFPRLLILVAVSFFGYGLRTAIAADPATSLQGPAIGVPPRIDEYVVFTSSNGESRLRGRVIDVDSSTVVLLRQTPWRFISVPLSRFSQVDQSRLAATEIQVLDGKVIGVADGDTLTVLDADKKTHRVRLLGVDAPELKQEFSQKSRAWLSANANGAVRVRWAETDQYKRLLGDVVVSGRWINFELVRAGWAWHFTKYSDDPALHEAEQFARKRKLGLWSSNIEPMAPWDFRNLRPPAAAAPSSTASPQTVREPHESPPTARVGRYWLNTSSGVRHNSSCQNFGRTKNGRACGPGEGKACGICGG